MCIHKTHDGACKRLSDGGGVEYCVEGPCPYDKPTNADRIRAMSDEELAVFLETLVIIALGEPSFRDNQRRLDWLRQPAGGSTNAAD